MKIFAQLNNIAHNWNYVNLGKWECSLKLFFQIWSIVIIDWNGAHCAFAVEVFFYDW